MKTIRHELTGAILFSYDGELRGANLSGANLSGVNLIGVNLSGANLSGANLSGANLRDANLIDANLRDADLIDANLRDANLRETLGVFSLGTPDNWPAHAWLRDNILSIRIGCREFRYQEALDYWQPMTGRQEQLAATEYARQIALARGWRIE